MVNATKRKRVSAEERRARILEGALRVFAERGYADASMAAIASAAGITPAVIYDHFASKADLHRALVEQEGRALADYVREHVDPEQGAERKLRTGIDAYLRFVEERPTAWRLLFRDPPADPELVEIHERLERGATETIADLMGYSRVTSARAKQSREIAAELLRAALNGAAAWWDDHREMPREEIVEFVMDFTWPGVEGVKSTRT